MPTGDDVSDIFLRLAQTSSVEAALTQGVRLACRTMGGLAAAIVVNREPGRRPSYWFRYDPQELLEQSRFEPCKVTVCPASSDSADKGNSDGRRSLAVRLSCGRREAGWLVLVTGPELNEEKAGCRLAAIAAALATLLLAVEQDATDARLSILGRDAFGAALAAQITKSQSRGEVFSVLHLRAAHLQGSAEDDQRPWSDVARLGEVLLARLRRTDIVGLMAPDHLAVLLAGTGRLGARIAARRIELLLSTPQIRARSSMGLVPSELTWCVRVFPEDSESASGLCEAAWHTGQTAPTAVAARVMQNG